MYWPKCLISCVSNPQWAMFWGCSSIWNVLQHAHCDDVILESIHKLITNVWQSDVNLSPLALPCWRILLMPGGVLLPTLWWVSNWLPTYLIFFPSSREKNVHRENRMFMHTCKNYFLMWTSLVSCSSRVPFRQKHYLNIGVTFGKSCNDEYFTILVTPQYCEKVKSKMTLNYRMIVDRYSFSNGMAGNSILIVDM